MPGAARRAGSLKALQCPAGESAGGIRTFRPGAIPAPGGTVDRKRPDGMAAAERRRRRRRGLRDRVDIGTAVPSGEMRIGGARKAGKGREGKAAPAAVSRGISRRRQGREMKK